MNRIVIRYKQFQTVFILYSVESYVFSDLHTNNSMSRKKVARELPQKRRKRGLLYLKNLTTRAGQRGPANGANLIMYWIIPENPKPEQKTRIFGCNQTRSELKKRYPNSSRTQLLYQKLLNPGPGGTPPLLVPKPDPNFTIPDQITIPTTVPLLILLLPAMSIFEQQKSQVIGRTCPLSPTSC